MSAPRYRSGPLAWCAIIGAACVLLFVFQKILWLVVPFLFALVIYYPVFPWQQRLVMRGMSRDAAAALVSAVVFAAAAVLAVWAAPWFGQSLASWQEPVARYVEGGLLRDGWRFKRFLGRAVPNAFFERTLYLLDQVDNTARLYFQGLIRLTLLDTVCLAAGLWLLGVSSPLLLGLITAVLAWVPYVGSIIGCLLVVLVAATDFPGQAGVAYGAIALFIVVRLLDDFVFMPLTIGRSLRLHPVLTVVMIFIGGAVAGVAGLMLALPLLGVVMVLGETIGEVITDPRLRARHAHAKQLRHAAVTRDLQV